MKNIAILVTCFNRKDKTLLCLKSLFLAFKPADFDLSVFVVDDASSDGTFEAIRKNFPSINLIKGNGNLFWAGGMRLAWEVASKYIIFDYFLLINDDVVLKKNFLLDLFEAENFLKKYNNSDGIYISSTHDNNYKTSYGGSHMTKNRFGFSIKKIVPIDKPQFCDLANANIMLIHKNVINKIGFFDKTYIHGIADYDYSLTANKNNISLVMSKNFGGYCDNDHSNIILTNKSSLAERIIFLKSPTGISYSNYLYFIRKHFPSLLIIIFFKLWLRTLFPGVWYYFKNFKI